MFWNKIDIHGIRIRKSYSDGVNGGARTDEKYYPDQ